MVTKELSTDALLDEYSSSMAKGLLVATKEVGHAVWPSPIFHPMEGDAYVSKHFFPRLYSDIRELEDKGFAKEDIAELFKYPSRLVRITYLYHVSHLSELSKDERINLAGKLLRYLSYLRSDPFVKEGRNHILDDRVVRALLKNLEIVDLKSILNAPAIGTLVSRASAILFGYSELLYFCHHQIGHEYHGPYDLGNEEVLIVRDYYDLKPDFWAFSADFPYGELTFFTIYKGADVKFDYSNRMQSSQPLLHHLSRFSISQWEYEDLTNELKLNNFYKEIEEAVTKGVKHVSALNKVDLMKKYGEMFFYAIKPIRDILGKDWHPPQGFYEDVEKQELDKNVREFIDQLKQLKNLTRDEQFEFLKSRLDPRNH